MLREIEVTSPGVVGKAMAQLGFDLCFYPKSMQFFFFFLIKELTGWVLIGFNP